MTLHMYLDIGVVAQTSVLDALIARHLLKALSVDVEIRPE